MKKIILLTVIVLINYNCTKKTESKYALISGELLNPEINNLFIYGNNGYMKNIKINSDGTFADTLKISAMYCRMFFDESISPLVVYVEKGDEVKLIADLNDPSKTSFVGFGAEKYNYALEKQHTTKSFFDNNQEEYRGEDRLYNLKEEEFLKMVGEFKQKREILLKETPELSANFIEIEEENINNQYLSKVYNYSVYNDNLSRKYPNTLEDFNFDNEKYFIELFPYREIVLNHFVNKLNDSSTIGLSTKTVQAFKSDSIKNGIAQRLSYSIAIGNKNNEALFNSIKSFSSDAKFQRKIKEKFQTIKKLKAGSTAPNFNCENLNGGKSTLSELRGKFVYIDVWATWCGPCRYEIPYFKTLEEEFAHKNIQFVSISLDDLKNRKKWKEFIETEQLTGKQLIAEDKFNSDFAKKYAIVQIPRFILIDPDGNIINADAPRPSEPEILQLFAEHI